MVRNLTKIKDSDTILLVHRNKLIKIDIQKLRSYNFEIVQIIKQIKLC